MIDQTINIIGLGGIGSHIAKEVARIGCERLILFDDDYVELRNFANQCYDHPRQIGLLKAEAMAEALGGIVWWHMEHGNEMEIVARCEKVGINHELRGVVIVAVDNIESRREIFSICKLNPAVPLYLEAGAAEDAGVVHAFIPHDVDHIKAYEGLLAALSEQGPPPCVRRGMGGQFASIVADWLLKFQARKLPSTLVSSYIHYEELPKLVSEPVIG